ncbi:MAG: adenosylmethionine--8-amino-7-oxononanoate transaminase [Planctomycetota bacterium]|nr:adenosylmethionine--8-amino-7-oxononanoate transaminase [Planctomycetota bacterium]
MSSQDDLLGRDRRVLWHPYTQHGLNEEPLAVVGAQGSKLRLADGSEVIDAISSWWTCLHGHAHPRLLEAMQRQAATLDHVLFAGCTHEAAVALAEKLVEITPERLTRVFFSDNGSTAVEVALKMVAQRWVHLGESQRQVFVALEGGYHGDTFGAMSVGMRDPLFAAFEPWLFEVRQVPARAPDLAAALAELGDRAAAVILEPLVQGAAGMAMHDEAFVRAVREHCDRHGIPMIADEVMTGFGRTGSLFACQRAEVSPDLMCLSKGLTGGVFPLAVTLASEQTFGAFLSEDPGRTFFHGHTFTAHPIGCAAAQASIDLCAEDGVVDRLDAIGARIEAGLGSARDDDGIADLRRTGNVVALELCAERRDYLSDRLRSARRRSIEKGVLLRPLGNVVYALPPVCVTDEECDRIVDAMLHVIRD